MTRVQREPTKLSPRSCGLCRFWAPWIKQSEFLGTCGGERLGQCVDRHETCAGYEMKTDLKELLA